MSIRYSLLRSLVLDLDVCSFLLCGLSVARITKMKNLGFYVIFTEAFVCELGIGFDYWRLLRFALFALLKIFLFSLLFRVQFGGVSWRLAWICCEN